MLAEMAESPHTQARATTMTQSGSGNQRVTFFKQAGPRAECTDPLRANLGRRCTGRLVGCAGALSCCEDRTLFESSRAGKARFRAGQAETPRRFAPGAGLLAEASAKINNGSLRSREFCTVAASISWKAR